MVDMLINDADSGLPEFALQVCDPARPHTLVPMPAPRFRFEFMLLPGEDPVAMQTPEAVAELTAGWLPAGAATVERSAVYTFHGLITTRWRSGRVLLAGDAAHQTPPFLGQGMCSGMRDAANLAWKLHAVLRGADEALLDTYQQEREPAVRSIVQAAVDFGRIICTLDPAQAAARDEAMLAAGVGRRGAGHERGRADGAAHRLAGDRRWRSAVVPADARRPPVGRSGRPALAGDHPLRGRRGRGVVDAARRVGAGRRRAPGAGRTAGCSGRTRWHRRRCGGRAP